MIKAWRLPDGRYTLAGERYPSMTLDRAAELESLGGEASRDIFCWVVPESALGPLGAEKVFGVVTGPSSCGCEPAGFRWVTESDVKQGWWSEVCWSCSRWGEGVRALSVHRRCDIVDVCGEADVAEQVYESEFRDKLLSTR